MLTHAAATYSAWLRALLATARALENPYWDEAKPYTSDTSRDWLTASFTSLGSDWQARERLVQQYAWAIPSPAALAYVACALGPHAVEMGAGTGYWAALLAQLGVDMLAYDSHPPDRVGNVYHSPRLANGYPTGQTRPTFFPVQTGDVTLLSTVPVERSLFLCWPPYHEPMAAQALAAFQGSRLVYIGEERGGCTADDDFFAALDAHWRAVHWRRLPQWWGIHDDMTIYDREVSA